MTAGRRSMVTAGVTLLALAMHAALAPAFAQQSDPRAIHKRMVQFHAAGNYAAALIEAQKYEAVVKARVGTSHRAYGGALHSLGIIYQAQGQHAQAEAHFKRAKALLEKAKGASATDVLGSLQGLAAVHAARRQYTEAEDLYRRAVAILEKAKGANHPDVTPTLVALTDVYARKGQFGEAETHYKRALALLEKAKGARPAVVAKALKVQLPPPEYIGRYKGAVIERVLPLVVALRECKAFACARNYQTDPTALFCVIVIPAIDGLVTPHTQEGMRQHEIGHCAGWPGDHPGARFQNPAPPKRPLLAEPPRLVQSPAPRSPLRQSPEPSLAQRVVLYEEEAADPAGKRFIGSAMWRVETVKSGAEQSLVLRCDLEIPERQLAMTISIRRNTSQAFRVTHTVEITVSLPTDFLFGGVNSVPGVLMKEAEVAKGAPLSGLAVKVTPTFYLLGLSAIEAEKQRNLELLRDRAWLDIPIVYSNGRRAIITVEKGASGERALAEAFRAWEPSAPPPPAPQESSVAGASRVAAPGTAQGSVDQAPSREVAAVVSTSVEPSPLPRLWAAGASQVWLTGSSGSRVMGSAVWLTETLAGSSGQPSELALRCDIEIDGHKLFVRIRRNRDQTLSASHTVEVTFTAQRKYPPGGIKDVPYILVRTEGTTPGEPLSGSPFKLTSDSYLFGFARDGDDANVKVELLKDRPWLDIAIVYDNGLRATIAVEKGSTGERAFAEAFRAWGR